MFEIIIASLLKKNWTKSFDCFLMIILKASLLMLLNLTFLLIKFQITEPLYRKELLPTSVFILMILNCNWLLNLDGLYSLENSSEIWLGADPIKVWNIFRLRMRRDIINRKPVKSGKAKVISYSRRQVINYITCRACIWSRLWRYDSHQLTHADIAYVILGIIALKYISSKADCGKYDILLKAPTFFGKWSCY